MPLPEIEALLVPAADDAILYLWAVNSLLLEALGVMAAWGFTYRANLAWVKNWIGPGMWARQRHELVLVGTRGAVRPPQGKSWAKVRARRHAPGRENPAVCGAFIVLLG